jgi:hypothetical protein
METVKDPNDPNTVNDITVNNNQTLEGYMSLKGMYFDGKLKDSLLNAEIIENPAEGDNVKSQFPVEQLYKGSAGLIQASSAYNLELRGAFSIGGLVGINKDLIKTSRTAAINLSATGMGGGLVGYNIGKIIASSSVASDIFAGSKAGGLVGSNNLETTRTYSTESKISINNPKTLIGKAAPKKKTEQVFTPGYIQMSFSTNYVRGGKLVGGLAGDNYAGSITNCYSQGVVEGTSYIGGLTGRNAVGVITDSYAIGEVSGTSIVGGLVGQNSVGSVRTETSVKWFWQFNKFGQRKVKTRTYFYAGGTIANSFAAAAVKSNVPNMTAGTDQANFLQYNIGALVGVDESANPKAKLLGGSLTSSERLVNSWYHIMTVDADPNSEYAYLCVGNLVNGQPHDCGATNDVDKTRHDASVDTSFFGPNLEPVAKWDTSAMWNINVGIIGQNDTFPTLKALNPLGVTSVTGYQLLQTTGLGYKKRKTSDMFQHAIDYTNAGINRLGINLGAASQNVGSSVSAGAQNVGTSVAAGTQNVGNSISAGAQSVGEGVTSGWKSTWSAISSVSEGLKEAIQNTQL